MKALLFYEFEIHGACVTIRYLKGLSFNRIAGLREERFSRGFPPG